MRKNKLTAITLAIVMLLMMALLYGCGDKVETVTDHDLIIDTVYGEVSGTYDGELTNSEVTGKGTFKDEEGNLTYEGQFEKGIFKGKGKLYGTNEYGTGTEIEGNFDGLDSIEGMKTVDGVKQYEGALSQFKHHATIRGDMTMDDIVYHGEGTMYNSDGKAIYNGKFENGKPVDKQGFMKKCKKYTSTSLLKYGDSQRGNLVKLNLSDIYIDTGLSYNNNIFLFDANLLLNDQNLAVIYQYHKGESRYVNGEDITIYGTIQGFFDNLLIIEALTVENR